MKKILLTGATGFIGSNILRELSHRYKFFCLIRSKKKIKKKNVASINFRNFSELNNILNKNKFFAVLHCATYYKKKHSHNDVNKMIKANLVLGNKILENKNILYCKKFINLTTTWENYNGVENNPANLYSAYKLAFSNILKFYMKKLTNTKFYNIYLSDTFGGNDSRKKLFNTLKEDYKKRKTTILLSKNIKMNIINVKDIVSGIDALLIKNIKQGNYSILNSSFTDVVKFLIYFNKHKKKKIKYK